MVKKQKRLRLFFGLPIPENRGEAFRKLIIEDNPKIEHRVRWVKPGNHHITVQFLGSMAEQKIPFIVSGVEASAFVAKPFSVTLRSITGFPTPESPIVAVSIQPSIELQSLHEELGLALESLKIITEKRAYNPHITLFRPTDSYHEQLNSISLNNEQLKISALILYKSLPEKGGSVYIPLHTFSFEH